MLKWAFVAFLISAGLVEVVEPAQRLIVQQIGGIVTAALIAVGVFELFIPVVWKLTSDQPLNGLFERLVTPTKQYGITNKAQFNFILEKMSPQQLMLFRGLTLSALGCILIGSLIWVDAFTQLNNEWHVTSRILTGGSLIFIGFAFININERVEIKVWDKFRAEFDRLYEVVFDDRPGKPKVEYVRRRDLASEQS